MQGQIAMYESTLFSGLLDMGLRSRRPTHVPLLTKRHRQLRLRWAQEHRRDDHGPWINGRELPDQINHGLPFITPMGVSGYAVLASERLLPYYTAGHIQEGGGGIMLWRCSLERL